MVSPPLLFDLLLSLFFRLLPSHQPLPASTYPPTYLPTYLPPPLQRPSSRPNTAPLSRTKDDISMPADKSQVLKRDLDEHGDLRQWIDVRERKVWSRPPAVLKQPN
jgi:hypothetical protein